MKWTVLIYDRRTECWSPHLPPTEEKHWYSMFETAHQRARPMSLADAERIALEQDRFCSHYKPLITTVWKR